MEQRKRDYLMKGTLDQCLKRGRPAEDPQVRERYRSYAISICDEAARLLNFAGETAAHSLGSPRASFLGISTQASPQRPTMRSPVSIGERPSPTPSTT